MEAARAARVLLGLAVLVEDALAADEVRGEHVRGRIEARGRERGVVEEAQQPLGPPGVDQADDELADRRRNRLEALERAADGVGEGDGGVERALARNRGLAEAA